MNGGIDRSNQEIYIKQEQKPHTLGDQIIPELGTTKAEVLLVRLCRQQRPIAREILAEMFWENRPLDRAQSNLRVA